MGLNFSIPSVINDEPPSSQEATVIGTNLGDARGHRCIASGQLITQQQVGPA
jgi:hypothetical protein